MVETLDESLPAGTRKVTESGKTGYSVSSVRVIYENGKEVRREKLTNSWYKMMPSEVKVGPAPSVPVAAPTEEPTTSPTTEPTAEPSPSVSPTPTATPEPTPSEIPTDTPSPTPPEPESLSDLENIEE